MEQNAQSVLEGLIANDPNVLLALQRFLASQQRKQAPKGLPPGYHGPIDLSYVRPAPHEFPKVMYHASGLTKIVNSMEEQEALGKAYSTVPPVAKPDWRAKVNETYTKSGFRVHTHHVAFLIGTGVQDVSTIQEAALFLDRLNTEEQEQFFKDAEEAVSPAPEGKKKSKAA